MHPLAPAGVFFFVACAECWLGGRWLVVRSEPWASPGNLLAVTGCVGVCCAVYDCLRVQVCPAHQSSWLRIVRLRTVLAVFTHLYLPFVVLILAGSVLGWCCCCRARADGLCSLSYHTLKALAWWTWLLLVVHDSRGWLSVVVACLYFLRVQEESRLLRVCALKLFLLWGLSHWHVPS